MSTDGRTLTEADLRAEIDKLKMQAADASKKYREKLAYLRDEMNRSVNELTQEQQRQSREQLNLIADKYELEHNKLIEKIRLLSQELNRKIKDDTAKLYRDLAQLRTQITAKSEEEKRLADEYKLQMCTLWGNLQNRKELLPYTSVHEPVLTQSNIAAEQAYKSKQYQAVTGIMVNNCSLIKSWEKEAEVLLEDWLEMSALCNEVIKYLECAIESSYHMKTDTEGIVKKVDLSDYDKASFAQIKATMGRMKNKYRDAKGMSTEAMRNFLKALESFRLDVDRIIENCTLMHHAYIRRLKTYKSIIAEMDKYHFRPVADKIQGDRLHGCICCILRNECDGNRIIININTADWHIPMISVSSKWIPAGVEDQQLQLASADKYNRIISQCIEKYDTSGRAHANSFTPFINNQGIVQSSLNVMYR